MDWSLTTTQLSKKHARPFGEIKNNDYVIKLLKKLRPISNHLKKKPLKNHEIPNLIYNKHYLYVK